MHWRKNQGGWRGNCPPSLKTRGALPPWFSDCYTSQGVGLTLWLVLALHWSLHCSFSSVATVIEYIYKEYIHDCGTWYVVAPQCVHVDIITDQLLSHVSTYTADFTSLRSITITRAIGIHSHSLEIQYVTKNLDGAKYVLTRKIWLASVMNV